MINLELPQKLTQVQQMAQQLASGVFRPISRKYDAIEHCDTPEELKPVAQMMAAMSSGGKKGGGSGSDGIKNGANMMGIMGVEAMCWGDVGLMLSIPGSGLGNAAISAVGTTEQKQQYGKLYCAMAITEPGAGSDSAAIRTTAASEGIGTFALPTTQLAVVLAVGAAVGVLASVRPARRAARVGVLTAIATE